MTTYTVEFGPAWPVPELTVEADDVNEFYRAVARHAIPHLEPVLAEKGHPEYADCYFHVREDGATGQFVWLDLATGKGVTFCAARISKAAS